MIYLDNAATTFPKPKIVIDSVKDTIENACGNPSRGINTFSTTAAGVLNSTRTKLAELFNAHSPARIIFCSNATDALNLAIFGMDLKDGDEVITTMMEHNSVARPLEHLRLTKNIDVKKISVDIEEGVLVSDIEKAISKNTKLIVINHASNVIGTINPIKEIGEVARKYNVPMLVDASQTAGIIDIDVERDNISLLAFPGHKGLLGPMGTGGLFIAEDVSLVPFKYGGTGVHSKDKGQPEELPYRYESGTLNLVGIAGLKSAVDFIQKEGIQKIKEHELKLTEILIRELTENKNVVFYGSKALKNRVATISINIKGISPADVSMMLDTSFGIAIRSGLHCAPDIHTVMGTIEHEGTVRISPGYFNTEEDINTFITAIQQISAE